MKGLQPRTLIALGLLLLVGAPLLWVASRPSDSVGDVAGIEETLRPPPAAVPVPTPANSPATSDSAAPPPPTTAPPADEPADPTPSPSSTSPNLVVEPGPQPVRLVINGIEVDAPVDPYGVDSRTGEMEVPENVTDVGWYRFGPAPGDTGSAVLAAHVDLAGQGPGVFFDLRKLEPGDLVTVIMDDDSRRSFEVVARNKYAKDELPLEVIFSTQGRPILTLITCGGGFNRNIGSYDSNVVVYAVPLGSRPQSS